jgi:hypothetical protein
VTRPSKPERIVAEDIAEATWIRMRRLKSSALCKRMIGERWKDLPAATLDEKAEHTAWAVKTALGYWQPEASSLNSRILLRYYALLQITAIFTFASSGFFRGRVPPRCESRSDLRCRTEDSRSVQSGLLDLAYRGLCGPSSLGERWIGWDGSANAVIPAALPSLGPPILACSAHR